MLNLVPMGPHQRRLVLFSGMGADGGLFGLIHVLGVELVRPPNIDPLPDETFPSYAARVAGTLHIKNSDVIGGASFGGMLAGEIARQRPVAGLVLLGTCLRPAILPRSYRLAAAFSRFLPDRALEFHSLWPLIRGRFMPLTSEAEACLVEMGESCPLHRLRALSRMVVAWAGVDRVECPILSIHGDKDRMVPLPCAHPGIVLKGAGHCFTLTHAEETSSAIQKFIAGLTPAGS